MAQTLQALERAGAAGSRFDVWKTLTEARHSGVVELMDRLRVRIADAKDVSAAVKVADQSEGELARPGRLATGSGASATTQANRIPKKGAYIRKCR